jgi:hypothetical protein
MIDRKFSLTNIINLEIIPPMMNKGSQADVAVEKIKILKWIS